MLEKTEGNPGNEQEKNDISEDEGKELARKGTRKLAAKTLPAILDDLDESLTIIANDLRISQQAAREAEKAAEAAKQAALDAGSHENEAKAAGENIRATAKNFDESSKEAIAIVGAASLSSDETRKAAEAALLAAREEADRASKAMDEAKQAATEATRIAQDIEGKIVQVVGVADKVDDLSKRTSEMIEKAAAEEEAARVRMLETAKDVLKSFLSSWQFVVIMLTIIVISVSIAVALAYIP